MHRRRELQSLEMHRRIAGRLHEEPVAVLGKARENLRRWIAARTADEVPEIYREWEKILEQLSVAELAALLVSDDEAATRLRQSTPFAGVLPPQEVWEIKRMKWHETA